MSDRYAVFGNPVSHSKSPAIHAAFAAACNQDLAYEAILAPQDGFADCVRAFVAGGGCGANVTLPFKREACRLATRLTPRARLAGAVNTLSFDAPEWLGDNTDGAGLLRDLTHNLGCPIAGMRVLLLGAGGAARGVLGPLLDAGPRRLVIANRTEASAHELAVRMRSGGEVSGCSYPQLAGQSFDLLINATSASLAGASLPLPNGLFAPGSLAYDMMYGEQETPFLRLAGSRGAARLADGLGMLVEQAAEAFRLWRGVRPATASVMAMLRSGDRQTGSR
ncbi:MAG: Shikimate dehydrogenase [Candidatus Accumulibacter sp. BA-94]|uniref:shikimate dehydrogenase n=1 Tax=Accumulibacter sp. TaxID=2053492 RepID=UPI000451D922|nr:shikimate dehydrogenase [Accumulibacter sp.]EXI91973.1 MAG: Shikimate dehydrogenase [Candidatus Accumulibacter sp. BA-94]MBL8392066.1 shikimate dehydrogenase [Accumulibacter sp.]HRD87174.1 shikimate dehydrogenase [Accumulibacter sp.]